MNVDLYGKYCLKIVPLMDAMGLGIGYTLPTQDAMVFALVGSQKTTWTDMMTRMLGWKTSTRAMATLFHLHTKNGLCFFRFGKERK